jgi:hypothetical protein
MYQRFVKFSGLVFVAFLSLLAGCSRQVQNGELGSSVTCPITPNPKTYYVKQYIDGGRDTNVGTSLISAWEHIAYAVNQACPGDTIRVQPGHFSGTTYAPYTENVVITTSGKQGFPISLIGEDWNKVKIAFTGANFNYIGKAAITLDNPNGEVTDWLIKGFRIDGCTSSATCTPYIYSGVYMENVRRIDVNQIWVYRSGGPGIMVYPRVNCYDTNTFCVTQNFDVDIFGNGIDYPNLGDVNGAYAQEALTLSLIDTFNVYDNIVQHGTKEGITVKDASRNGKIYGNTVSDFTKLTTSGAPTTSVGIYIGGQKGESFNIDVYKNKVYNNYGDGIVIATEKPSCNQNGVLKTWTECLTYNPPGPPLDNHDMRVYNNVVYNNGNATNGKGIAIGSHTRNIEVYHNTFVGNYKSLLINNNYGGYFSKNLTFRNNIFMDTNRAYIQDVGIVTFGNNLFNNGYPYDLGPNTSGVTGGYCTNVTGPGTCSTATYNKVTALVASAMFVNTTAGSEDFHLKVGTPALRAGNTNVGLATSDASTPAVTRPQPAGSRPDQGAYESPN